MARVTREQLLRLQKKCKTDAAIGALFKISRQAVHQLRLKYGVAAVEEKNQERNQEIARLFTRKVPGGQIAKKYHLSLSQAYRIANEIHRNQKTKS